MLHAASRPADDFPTDLSHDFDRPSAIGLARSQPEERPAPGRYGAGSRPNIPVIAAILIFHVLLIAALVQVRSHVQRMQEAKLTVVNLSPPPPPPSAETPPPPPSTPEIVTPPPIVQTPVPPVLTVQTTPDPVPVPVPTNAPLVAAVPKQPLLPAATQNEAKAAPVDLTARLISSKPPRYPIESRRKREQGTVELMITLTPDGTVGKIWVSKSSGFTRLDKAALDAVRDWRWAPNPDGKPLTGWLPFPFVLRSDAA